MRPIEAALQDALKVTGADQASLWMRSENVLCPIRILPKDVSIASLELPLSASTLPAAEPRIFGVDSDEEAMRRLGEVAQMLGVDASVALKVWERVGLKGMRTFGVASVVVGDEITGYLLVGGRRPSAFPPEHVRFLQALARQVGVGIETRQRLHTSKRRQAVLRVLQDSIAALALAPEPDDAMQRVVEGAGRVAGDRSAAVLLYDEAAHEFRATAAAGKLGEQLAAVAWKSQGPECPLFRAYTTTTPWVAPRHLDGYPFPFSVVVPLSAAGERFGLLLVADEEWRPAEQELVSSLVTLGQVAAAALYHARLRDALVLRERELRTLSDQLMEVHEGERRRHARSIHDVVVQGLAAMGLELGMASKALARGDARDAAVESVRATQEIIAETRHVVSRLRDELRPRVLDELGLEAALASFCESLAHQHDMQVVLHVADGIDIDPSTSTTVYRAAQEAVSNAIHHGSPSRVEVELTSENGMVTLAVRDDGCGFNIEASRDGEHRPGIGLLSMQERARALRGRLDIDTAPGEGTRVRFAVPASAGGRP